MQDDKASGVNLKYYLAVIIRRRYLALSVAILVLSACTWGSFFMPKVYQASCTVLIDRKSIIDPLINGIGFSRDALGGFRESILSKKVLEAVIEKLHMVPLSGDPKMHDGLITSIRKNLEIKQVGGSPGNDLFMVSYSGSDPKMVRDLINVLVKEYIEENVGLLKNDAADAFDFIKSQVLEYKNKLEESDRAVREFREKNPQLIPQNESTIVSNVGQLQQARMNTDLQLKELIRKRESLRRQLSGEKELTVALVSNENSPQGRLTYLNNQLMILMSKYTSNYPEVLRVKAEIEELKKEMASAPAPSAQRGGSEMSAINPIYQRLKEELANTDAELESLRAKNEELSRQQQEEQALLGRMPREQEEWTKLERDRQVYQNIYDQLLHKLESARVSSNLENSSKYEAFKVMDAATLPLVPVKPNRVTMILFGIVLGIASGAGLVIGLDHFNHPFKDESHIESGLRLPVLCTIPGIVMEEEKAAERARDKRVFIGVGVYLFIIGLVLANEFLFRYLGLKTIIF